MPPPATPAAPPPLSELEAAHQAEGAGDLAGARAHLERAVRAAPGLGLAQVDLADVLLRLGEEGPELAAALEAGQRLEPGNPRIWKVAGAAAEDAGNAPAAIAAYEHALQLRPDDVRSRFRLAGLYAAGNRVPEAIAAYRAVSAADPNDRGARLALAELLERRGELAGAEAELQVLVGQDPKNALYRDRLQRVLVAEGKAAPAAETKRAMRPLRKSKW